MGLKELLAWQWAGYSHNHATRAKLLPHVGAVPLFLIGNAVARLVLEQSLTFPRFVLSGGWRRALQCGA